MKTTINNFSRVLSVLLLCAGLAMTGCYDDSALQEQIGGVKEQLKDHESRLKELERLTAQQNTNIGSLQTIVNALQDKDYVTNISPINESDKVVGYTITFSKSGTVTIYNGKDGEDGNTSHIGVKLHSDELYYWTVDGEWLTDLQGNMVRASAKDGEDGVPGVSGPEGQPGITPLLKIIDGYWYVSYDGGKTWEDETLGQATGDKGYAMFAEVVYDEEYLYITMADGEKLTLPRSAADGDSGKVGPATFSIEKVTATTATLTCHLDIPTSDLPFSYVTIYYSNAETFNMNAAESVSTTAFDNERNVSITLTNLKYGTKYNYCMVAEVKSEKTYGDVLNFTTETVSFRELTIIPKSFEAEVSGQITGLSEEDKEHIKLGILYSDESGKVENLDAEKMNITEITADGSFALLLSGFTLETKYYYCGYVCQDDNCVYDTVAEFTTLQHPYVLFYDLDMSSATDLSSSASANCYIVSGAGLYKFKTVKGNGNEPLANVASAEILWETFGTDVTPAFLDLISEFCYKDGYIAFKTADIYKEGNAVIAAKDVDGNILWSWHIWFTDQPREQVYYNNAGTMMDRNLGATSATPGYVGTFGLRYQWGRKDPFLGYYSTKVPELLAASTITWPSTISSDSNSGTIEYATAHPTTIIKGNSNNDDWYYSGNSSTDTTRWTTSETMKSIYDPCPVGWRVPDGGENGVWSKALGSSSWYTGSFVNGGMDFSGKFGSASTIWYPYYSYCYTSGPYVLHSHCGRYWSASPYRGGSLGNCMWILYFDYDALVKVASTVAGPANRYPVRCIKE